MKNSGNFLLILGLTLGLCFTVTAQPPEKMSFQMVVRDAGNMLVTNQSLGVRISILRNAPNGNSVYTETHTASTNGNGLLTLEIGTGQPTPGSVFDSIDWSRNTYYLKSEIDLTGGNNYTISGAQQLVTVPYAFFAKTFKEGDYENLYNRPAGQNTGDILYWNAGDSSWHIIAAGSAGQVLTMTANGIPQWHTSYFNQNAPPTIVTDTIYNITGYTMDVGATIVNPGTTGIIASGVCWSTTNPSPSLGNNSTTDGSGTGSFVSHVSGLNSSTLYYIRAYATNSIGTSYGNVITITTPTHCGTVTDYDGNVYNTVYIGRQCWFKENLRTTHYADGNAITRAQNVVQTYYDAPAHYQNANSCYYFCNHDSTTKQDRGLLYTWYAVMKGAGSSDNNPSGILGVCPYGWHVPSSSEWCELENTLNPGIDVNCSNVGWRGTMAKMLSQPKYWSSYSNNSFTPGYWHTDSTGFNTTDFSLIPTGYIYMSTLSWLYYYSGGYNSSQDSYLCPYSSSNHSHYQYNPTGLNTSAFFWTSSSGKYRQISYSETGIYYNNGQTLTNAYSMRCVKDY